MPQELLAFTTVLSLCFMKMQSCGHAILESPGKHREELMRNL